MTDKKKKNTPQQKPEKEDPAEKAILEAEQAEQAENDEFSRRMTEGVANDKGKPINMPTSNKTVLKALDGNEVGDTFLFVQLFKDKYLFDHASGLWYYWNDHYWRFDELNHVPVLMQEVVALYDKQMQYESYSAMVARKEKNTKKTEKHEYRVKAIRKRVDQLQTLHRKNNILKQATYGKGSLGFPGNDWDTKPWLFGCKNGVIDLKTGKYRKGKPGDYIKTVSPIEWKGIDAPCPTWEKFMLDIFGQDKSIVDYIQRLFGYGITGLTTEHIYPILWGKKGRNGKSTMLETLKYVLGPMAHKAPANFFMQQRQGKATGSHDAELMSFRGARFIWGSESNDGDRLDTARLKELVGGDTISARPPYGRRQVEFKPTYLLLLLTNLRPRIPASDSALWRRIHLIPFLYSFIDNPDPENPFQLKDNKNLGEALEKEASGILAWLVDGCRAWDNFGLLPPDSINNATAEYRADEDIVGHFIEECCDVGSPILRVGPKKLYDEYKKWCTDVGHFPLAKPRFLKDIRERYGKMKTKRGTRTFRGIALRQSSEMDV